MLEVAQDQMTDLRARLGRIMEYQGDAGISILWEYDAVTATWMAQLRAVGNTNTQMAFTVSASPILADRGLYKGEATRQGQRATGTATIITQGTILTSLATVVMAVQIDRPLVREEWESCLWPAVVWVGHLVECWEKGLPQAMREAVKSNAAYAAMVVMAEAPQGLRDKGVMRQREDGPEEGEVGQ